MPRCRGAAPQKRPSRMTTVIGMTGLERGRRDAETFDGGQHGDRRRDHAVGVEQRRAEQRREHQRSCRSATCGRRCPPWTERAVPGCRPRPGCPRATKVRYLTTTTMISDQTISDSTRRRSRSRSRPRAADEALAQRVQRRRADVAVDDAERAERERAERAVDDGCRPRRDGGRPVLLRRRRGRSPGRRSRCLRGARLGGRARATRRPRAP